MNEDLRERRDEEVRFGRACRFVRGGGGLFGRSGFAKEEAGDGVSGPVDENLRFGESAAVCFERLTKVAKEKSCAVPEADGEMAGRGWEGEG